MARTPNIDLREDYQRNYLINGNFDFWQRGASFVSPSGANYTADRWVATENGSGTATLSRSTDTPNNKSTYSFLWECTASAALTSNDTYIIEQRIEGYNFQSLLDRTFTVSFWVKTNKPGTYSVSFVNAGRDRAYTTEFVVTSPSTWEEKFITVTHDSAGTWDTTNGVGLRVIFGLGTGSNFSTSNLDQWESADVRGSANSENIQDTVGNQFFLTQAQMVEGAEALPFRRAGRSIGEELILCERYYEKSYDVDIAPGSVSASGIIDRRQVDANTTFFTGVEFRTRKRALPAVVTYARQSSSPNTVYNNSTASVQSSTIFFVGEGSYGVETVGAQAARSQMNWHHTVDAEL